MQEAQSSKESLEFVGLYNIMNVLLLDGMNLIHRARSGFAKGEHSIVFSFFRSLKPIIEKFKPDNVYFVLEGNPRHRKNLLNDYKKNRKSPPDSFWKQKDEILNILSMLPITVIKHPDYECDDVIANLAKRFSENNNVTVVSTDSDFIQLWDTLNSDNLKLYNPVKKAFVEKPDYCYLDWKAFKGDVSDNIPGIPGVGDKTANRLVTDNNFRNSFLSDKEKLLIFERNKELIKFHWLEQSQDSEYIINEQNVSLDNVKNIFKEYDFKSMLNDKYWAKFKLAFENLCASYKILV